MNERKRSMLPKFTPSFPAPLPQTRDWRGPRATIRDMTSSSNQPPHVPSPFDPHLTAFLRSVRAIESGFSPTANSAAIAEQLNVEPAFIEMLTTSARRRRFIEPFYAPAHRNTLRWRISARGEAFLALQESR